LLTLRAGRHGGNPLLRRRAGWLVDGAVRCEPTFSDLEPTSETDVIVLLFDIDGTLIRSGGAGARATTIAMTRAFGIPDPQGVPLHGCTDRGIARDLFALHGLPNDESNWERFLAAYLEILAEELPKSPGEVLPGVEPLLDRLGERDDVYLGLLTGNVRRGARRKLEHYGLYHRFRDGGFGDHHPDRDDVARQARRTVEAELGPIPNERLWVIGDTPADVRCGRAIGARVLAVGTGGIEPHVLQATGPDLWLADLTEADRWLERLA